MINLRGHHFNCLPDGGLFWVNKETLIISDLHLEKGSSIFKEGQFISPNDIINKVSKFYLKHIETKGVVFNPLFNKWKLSDDTDVNYMCYFKKD